MRTSCAKHPYRRIYRIYRDTLSVFHLLKNTSSAVSDHVRPQCAIRRARPSRIGKFACPLGSGQAACCLALRLSIASTKSAIKVRSIASVHIMMGEANCLKIFVEC